MGFIGRRKLGAASALLALMYRKITFKMEIKKKYSITPYKCVMQFIIVYMLIRSTFIIQKDVQVILELCNSNNLFAF